MDDFRKTLEDFSLVGMGHSGTWFMWERENLPDTNTRKRLDRSVANTNWMNLFLDFSVRHLPHSFFVHCLLFIQTDSNECVRLKKSFLFEV